MGAIESDRGERGPGKARPRRTAGAAGGERPAGESRGGAGKATSPDGLRGRSAISGAAGARSPSRSPSALRVEAVDHWHAAWPRVLKLLERTGSADKLRVDGDGWLSARQVLMVAFVGATPVAHVCFSVRPSRAGCIEANLDAAGADPNRAGRGIESTLHRAAVERARALRCERLAGFELRDKSR